MTPLFFCGKVYTPYNGQYQQTDDKRLENGYEVYYRFEEIKEDIRYYMFFDGSTWSIRDSDGTVVMSQSNGRIGEHHPISMQDWADTEGNVYENVPVGGPEGCRRAFDATSQPPSLTPTAMPTHECENFIVGEVCLNTTAVDLLIMIDASGTFSNFLIC